LCAVAAKITQLRGPAARNLESFVKLQTTAVRASALIDLCKSRDIDDTAQLEQLRNE
jgi:hypothetical protein